MTDSRRLRKQGRWLTALSALSLLLGAAAPAADPYEAYREGRYDEALEGFLAQSAERPEDSAAALAVGNSHYRLGDFALAQEAFERAAGAEDETLRQHALYNAGNAAFRRGRLEEAARHYRLALEIDPDDEDAQHNLGLTLRELAQRQQRASQPGGEDGAGEAGGGSEPGPAEGSTDPAGGRDPGSEPEPSNQGESEPGGGEGRRDDPAEGSDAPSPSAGGPPGMGSREEPLEAEPPSGPDAGRGPETAEDEGRLAEPSPPDGGPPADPGQTRATGGGSEADTDAGSGTGAGMSAAEARRLLAALDEGRPDLERKVPAGARRAAEKDW